MVQNPKRNTSDTGVQGGELLLNEPSSGRMSANNNGFLRLELALSWVFTYGMQELVSDSNMEKCHTIEMLVSVFHNPQPYRGNEMERMFAQ